MPTRTAPRIAGAYDISKCRKCTYNHWIADLPYIFLGRLQQYKHSPFDAHRWSIIRSYALRGSYGKPPPLRRALRVREYTSNKFITYPDITFEEPQRSRFDDGCTCGRHADRAWPFGEDLYSDHLI